MKLRGIDFGNVLDASGVRGFFGEGYWYHKVLRPFGLNFQGCTFVAKTTTLLERAGNMKRAADDISPAEMFPRCIVVRPFKGVALNAVGLSGPGAVSLFCDGRWQARRKPFFISFMSVEPTAQERVNELQRFTQVFRHHHRDFRAPIGLQINYSCPNVGLKPLELVGEIAEGLSIAGQLGIPLMPKFNVTVPVSVAREVCKHPACDAICVSNSIPWGALPDKIDWKDLFGQDESPLAKLRMGGGGLSGAPLLSLTEAWIREARRQGIEKPINGGGGILRPSDVDVLVNAGASSVFLGSIAMLRGWRVQDAIRRANLLYARGLNPIQERGESS